MNIVFICSGGPFTDDTGYQENLLAKVSVDMGDNVHVIARPDRWVDGEIKMGSPGSYRARDGYYVHRLPFSLIGPTCIQRRIVKFRGLNDLLDSIKPDCIFLHGMGNLAMIDVVNYKKKNNCTIIADTHAERTHQSKHLIVRALLYKGIYRHIVKHNIQFYDKVIAVSETCAEFASYYFGIDQQIMDIWPLGGVIPTEETMSLNRAEIRKSLNIPNDAVVFIHTGKLDADKRSGVVLEAFSQLDSPKSYLIVVGTISKDIAYVFEEYQNHENIIFYGWTDLDNLNKLLQASDVYLQPGTASATLQQAICNGCAAIARLRYQYHDFFEALIPDAESVLDFKEEMQKLCVDDNLACCKKRLRQFAVSKLDYHGQVKRIHSIVNRM